MKEIEPNFPKKVVFTPEKDDFIYLSRAISITAAYSRRAQYLFNAFLLVNAILIPGLLLFLGYFALGLAIFLIDIVIVIFLVPMNEKKADLDYLNRFYDHIGEHEFAVELTSDGIRSMCDGCETFLSWEHITAVQESTAAIYFFRDRMEYL